MHDSLWSVTAQVDRRPALAEDIPVDVAIIGAGITGLTAARELSRRGKRVAVLEARAVGAGVTGGTTAHITEAIDTRYTTLEKDFGREGARLAAASSREALEHIRRVVAEEAISCGLEAVAGYLYTERREDTGAVEEELAAMERAGLRVSTTNDLPVPLRVCAALRLEDQGQFHALAYLAGLARAVEARGGAVWEGTRVLSVEETDEGCHVHTEAGPVVRAQHVVLATHAPLNAALLGTKVAQYRSYVIACPVAAAVPALLWDTADPYHYTRWCTVDGRVYLIVGGEDHKTGLGDATDAPFARLLAFARERFAVSEASHRWSAQVVEPVDGLPFIGPHGSPRTLVATGYSGNGMTFGTVAGLLLAARALGEPSPYAELYAASRIKPMASLPTYLGENKDFPLHLLSGALARPEVSSLAEIAPGQGKLASVAGHLAAVYRDRSGGVTAVSSICTHMGCRVRFNAAEHTWDCPCHGSRFDVEGAVVDGPATRPLRSLPLKAD